MPKNQHVYGLNALKVIVINSKREQRKMIDILEEHGIKIVYDELKKNKTFHPLWCIHGHQCALMGASIIHKVHDKIIIRGLNELKEMLKKAACEDC